MDCTKFKDTKSAVPNTREREFLAHLGGCPDCAEFANQIDCMEAMLMRTVEVGLPDGLAEQVMLKAAPTLGWRARLRTWLGFGRQGGGIGIGLAGGAFASVAVVAVTAFFLSRETQTVDPMVDKMVAHVLSEPGLQHADERVDAGIVAAAFQQYGARVNVPIGEIRHLGECVVDGVVGHHVMVKTPEGEATLILLPRKGIVTQAPQTTHGLSALMVRLPKGTMGIVSESPERVQRMRSYLSRRVEVQG